MLLQLNRNKENVFSFFFDKYMYTNFTGLIILNSVLKKYCMVTVDNLLIIQIIINCFSVFLVITVMPSEAYPSRLHLI